MGALALIGGCALVAAALRASRWWAHWGSVAKPYELIPTVCFGAGAGLVLALPVYAVAVRAWRPAPATERPADADTRRPDRTAAR